MNCMKRCVGLGFVLALSGAMAAPATGVAIRQWGLVSWGPSTKGGASSRGWALPVFVHQLNAAVQVTSVSTRSSKMQLECAVAYFLPPLNTSGTLAVDLRAEFTNGEFTHYYPYAENVPEVGAQGGAAERGANSNPSLSWENLLIGDIADPFETTAPSWLAARAVMNAGTLKVQKQLTGEAKPGDEGTTEGDVFLFYRGRGNAAPPLKLNHTANDSARVSLNSATPTTSIPSIWRVDVKPSGAVGFEHLQQFDPVATPSITLTNLPKGEAYAAANLDELKFQLRQALNAEGLFDDESAAAIAGIEEIWLKQPGARLLFILPRNWADATLPLTPGDGAYTAQRTFVGSIELAAD